MEASVHSVVPFTGEGQAGIEITPARRMQLIAEVKSACPDYMMADSKYKSVEEMFGNDKTDLELRIICDGLYGVGANVSIRCLTSRGTWALFRHEKNDRGDPGSTISR